MIATTVSNQQPIAPLWSYARQIVTGTSDVPVLDKSGIPLPAGTFIVFQAISDNGTGDARIKFSPADLASNAVIVSGVSASSHQGLEWDDASTLRLSTSATAGRAVFVFKYRLPS
ncbi:hypothetical protein [uncultured Thiothrix sp.]|uniref:hypothetical protein n=1 Tax=uncultured Thiothrix sp. TaxID=223185 RepID=UPI0026118C53|nr:hypothetical protein [uncultured Thiothrix sp.]